MRVGYLSDFARVVCWLYLGEFRVGARVVVYRNGLSYVERELVRENRNSNIAFGNTGCRVALCAGEVYELSLLELMGLCDCMELNFCFRNCYLSDRVVFRDGERVVLEFVEKFGEVIPYEQVECVGRWKVLFDGCGEEKPDVSEVNANTTTELTVDDINDEEEIVVSSFGRPLVLG